jgi:hypothetical protein
MARFWKNSASRSSPVRFFINWAWWASACRSSSSTLSMARSRRLSMSATLE